MSANKNFDDDLSDAIDNYLADGGTVEGFISRAATAFIYAAPQQRTEPESSEETEFERFAAALEELRLVCRVCGTPDVSKGCPDCRAWADGNFIAEGGSHADNSQN